MARVVQLLGRGGQSFAERVLGWSRPTIRKGQLELSSGRPIIDRFHDRGRKSAEESFPELIEHIRLIVEPTGQADPTFRSTRTYIPLTAASVRERLIAIFGYKSNDLPCVRTISNKLAALNYRPQKVAKCRPVKKIPETDAIFDSVHEVNDSAKLEQGVLRLSIDTKATVHIGNFSRGGYSRNPGKAYDHDFESEEKLTPFGLFLPETGKSYLWFTPSKVTADFMVDRLEEIWPTFKAQYNPHKLVINADNGPECSGVRRQWLRRLLEFAQTQGIEIELAYYPPYHSKYNPVERLWGVLENHWRGELIDSVEKALGLARTMSFRSVKPVVKLVRKVYKSGVTLTKNEMDKIEACLDRKKGLENWSIIIWP